VRVQIGTLTPLCIVLDAVHPVGNPAHGANGECATRAIVRGVLGIVAVLPYGAQILPQDPVFAA